MMYTSLKAVLPLLAAGAAAKTIRVDVGTNGLIYTPDTVTADPGDVVEFHFSQLQHSVVAADFSNPCTPLGASGFFSGIIQTTTDSPVFQVTVTSTNPFFYCAVDQHCQSGMVGVINPGSGQTLDQFRNAAKGAQSGPTPNAPYGGQLISGGGRSSTSSSHTSSSTRSSSSSSSSTSVSESSVSESSSVQTTAVQTTAVQSTAVTRATTATAATVQPTAAAWGLTPPLGAIGGVLAGVAAFVV